MRKAIKTAPFILAVVLLSFYGCDKEEEPMVEVNYMDVMASKVKMELVDDASISPYMAIYDVSPVYNDGHLPFSTDAGGLDGLESMLGSLDKSKTYLVYCHGDAPSIAAAELMIDNGFENVHRLQGNYSAWDEISFVDLSAAMAKAKIDAGMFDAIFDVSPVYDQGHLPGATNANASGGGTDLATLIDGMDKNKKYLVYCHGDAPAMAGAQLMEDAGFNNVFRLEGNYGAWVDAGYDVEM